MLKLNDESFFWSKQNVFCFDFDYGEDGDGEHCSLMCTYLASEDEYVFEYAYKDGSYSPAVLPYEEEEFIKWIMMTRMWSCKYKEVGD